MISFPSPTNLDCPIADPHQICLPFSQHQQLLRSLYIPTSTCELHTQIAPPCQTSHFSSSFLSYQNPSFYFLPPLCLPSSTDYTPIFPSRTKYTAGNRICLGSNPETRADIVQSRSKRNRSACQPHTMQERMLKKSVCLIILAKAPNIIFLLETAKLKKNVSL